MRSILYGISKYLGIPCQARDDGFVSYLLASFVSSLPDGFVSSLPDSFVSYLLIEYIADVKQSSIGAPAKPLAAYGRHIKTTQSG